MTYGEEFFEADPIVLVFVTLRHQLLDNFSNFVSRQGQIGLLEQIMELVVADVAVVVQICTYRKNAQNLLQQVTKPKQ